MTAERFVLVGGAGFVGMTLAVIVLVLGLWPRALTTSKPSC